MPKCAKRRFRDRVSAELCLAVIRRTDGSRRHKLEQRAYPCPMCRGWHLTSTPKRGR